MKRRLLALLLVCMALLLSACGVVYVNPYADIPKPVAVFTLDIDGQSYVMRFTLDPGYAPNTVSGAKTASSLDTATQKENACAKSSGISASTRTTVFVVR